MQDPTPAAAGEGPSQHGGPDRLSDWIDLLHELYPPAHAEDWDAVGLHVGDLERDTVGGVLVSLDVTLDVLYEAAAKGADLLISHHPLLFRPLPRLTADTAPGRLALAAARMGIAVAAAHTNLDKAAIGTSNPAAALLGLRGLTPLDPVSLDPQVKLVTFTPRSHTADVRTALAEAGAGVIGDYEACSFRTPGTGSFRPSAGARPFIGDPGEPTEVEEDRIETILPAHRRAAVVQALTAAHPYEEVPVDLYPLVTEPHDTIGLGLVGDLPQPTPLDELVHTLAEGLPNPLVRLAAHDRQATATRVAVIGGAGGSMIDTARRAGADVVVTGDVGHHVALDALTMGVAVIDAGHWGTEWPAMRAAADVLGMAARDRGLASPVHPSLYNTDPWTDWNMT